MSRILSVGVDLGAGKTVIVQDDADLVLTETGGISRPSLVSFFGKSRLVGEEAAAQQNESTVSINFDLLGKTLAEAQQSELNAHRKARLIGGSDGRVAVKVQYNDEAVEMDSASLLGMFLAKQDSRIGVVTGSQSSVNLCFVLPPDSSSDVRRTIREGASIASIDLSRVHLVDKVDCMLTTYERKFQGLRPAEKTNLAGKNVLMIEMGQCNSTAVLLSMPDTAGETNGNAKPEKLAYSHDGALGALYFDIQMFQHFADLCVTKYRAEPVVPGSKRGTRLLTGCERLRKLLSQLPEGSVTVENMTDSGDVTLALKRDEMSAQCEPLLKRFKELIVGTLKKARVAAANVYAVEVLGGGSRMQVVQAIITEVFGSEMPLGAKFDDSSIALGAAIYTNKKLSEDGAGEAEVAAETGDKITPLSEEQLSSMRAKELEMQQLDADLTKVLAVRNSLEAYLLDMRGAPRRKFGNSIDSSKLNALLDDTESWLWDNSEAPLAELESKNASLQSAVGELCKAFFEAVEKERVEVEKQLEKDAAAAAAERAEGGEEDDHDNRKLKYADRLRLVTKNKEEGTELFQGAVSEQQFRTSAARYTKALSHCMKFFDLSPEQEKEVKALKVVLYLNISSCYLKINNPDACINNCNHAIELDAKNAKAYFRRSMGQEAKKEWDKALEDIKMAQNLMDVEDKALTVASKRIKGIVAEEKKKEKGFWGKAFGI